MLTSGFIVSLIVSHAAALDGPVGRLPAMGYNSFNAFGCNYNASILEAQAKVMYDRGLVDASYKIFSSDDCYALKQRNATGHMVDDRTKFPDGIASFSDHIRTLGMRLAAYGDNGYKTCAGYPGSYGHEMQDLETWYSWGMTYLKYDNCYIPADNVTQDSMIGRFTRMSDAIAEFAAHTNVTFQYSLCQWGWQQPWVWGRRIAQSWRNTGDIKPWWAELAAIINTASFHPEAANFYGHNDLDLLEVGNTDQGNPPGNLTYDEAKSHFTAWALLKSPLFISTDLRNASEETFEILGNKDIIKINQDPIVGESLTPFRWGVNENYFYNATHPAEYWSGNSSYGIVFMVLNSLDISQQMSFNLTESWAIRTGRQYEVYDLWKHEVTGVAVRNITVDLPPHGVAALLLSDDGPEPESLDGSCALYYQCSWPNGTYISN